MHEGLHGGHFSHKVTTHHIIKVGYYWPTIFKYWYSFIGKCSTGQKIYGWMKWEVMPLHEIYVYVPFMQWGLGVICPINPKSCQGHSYIVTTTHYFTKWQEARDLKKLDTYEFISFIK